MLSRLKRPFGGRDVHEGAAKSRRGFGSRVAGIFERSRITDDDWEELEELLISGDVGPDLALDLVNEVKDRVKSESIKNPTEMLSVLRDLLVGAVDVGDPSVSSTGTTTVVLVVGVNGSGKTTTVAKLARWFQQNGQTSILAAADTFRAGAIDQLKIWGERLDIRVVAQAPGSDPAAVAFDAAAAAVAAGVDYLIVDTAGRLQTDRNLMDELRKVSRVLGKQVGVRPARSASRARRTYRAERTRPSPGVSRNG